MSKLMKRYEQLSIRERGLVVITLLAFIYFLFSFTVFSYLDEMERSNQQTLSSLEQNHDQLDTELQLLSSLLNTDPDKAKKQQINALKIELNRLEGSLNRLSVGLIPANELPQLLKRVLEKIKQLKLQSIRTLPVSQLSLQGEVVSAKEIGGEATSANDAESSDVETAGVFKHAVEVDLIGGYFETQHFISGLEALPWRLYWDSLEYSVTSYPNAAVSLQVYTLSTDQGAFGEAP